MLVLAAHSAVKVCWPLAVSISGASPTLTVKVPHSTVLLFLLIILFLIIFGLGCDWESGPVVLYLPGGKSGTEMC